MKYFKTKLISAVVFGLLWADMAWAGMFQPDTAKKIKTKGEDFGAGAGFAPNPPGQFIATIIEAFLGILGVIFIILIIVAGFNWMTAGGDEEKLRKAKDKIWRAIIGLIIIASAYAITYFVFKNLPMGEGSGGGFGG